MYAIAQQMIQSGTNVDQNLTKGMLECLPGACHSNLPFDPSMFSDPVFRSSMEEAAAAFKVKNANRIVIADDKRTTASVQYTKNGVGSVDGHGGATGGIYDGFVGTKAAMPPNTAVTVLTNTGVTPTHSIVPMPAPRQPLGSSPSARAAGKRPMVHPPTTATTTKPPSTPSNDRTTKAKVFTFSFLSPSVSLPLTLEYLIKGKANGDSSPPSSNPSHKSRPQTNSSGSPSNQSKNNSKIWSTSTIEERERIKEFWLGLGEEERRNLVKIEKDAVLKKMKEQQKHSCSCAVCGRKRFVISF
jgi:hypothetical protein